MNNQEYNELWQLTEEAADRLITGEGRSGTHYELIALLRTRHKVTAMTREEAVKLGRQICDYYLLGRRGEFNFEVEE